MAELLHRELTGKIIDAAIEVHSELGPGLLESAYEACLARLLTERGHDVQRQLPVPVSFRGLRLDCGYRMDLLVDQTVIAELKATESLHPVNEAQLLSHLKLSDLRVGLPINFHETRLTDGIKRMIN